MGHGKGYVHSDFKPSQIMLSKDNVAKLGDFGMTCTDGTEELAGSPLMISPELLKTKKRTYSADMWAMGVSLHMLFNNGKEPRRLRNMNTAKDLFRLLHGLEDKDVLYRGSGRNEPLDQLIQGLLTVRVS